jgi:quinol monooxygenase YgiN
MMLPAVYLLSIRGTLAPSSLEAARNIHNQTAGAPASVAAARGLGDLSHMVYIPFDQPKLASGEFLILDLWNNMEGLNQFFANPHVQEQAGQIFRSRDPVVWTPSEGLASYHYPAPYGANDPVVAIVRGSVKSREEAQARHNTSVAKSVNKARMAGNMSHEAYFKMVPPGNRDPVELIAIDVWMNASGMNRFYQEPESQRNLQELFSGTPSMSIWTHPVGDWVEW